MPAVNVWLPADLHAEAKRMNVSPSVVAQIAMRDTLAVLGGARSSNRTVRDIIEANEARTRNDPPSP